MIDFLESLGNAQQLIAEAPGRMARGQTRKIEWRMDAKAAPAAPSVILKQYGVKIGGVYCDNHKEDDGEGGERTVHTGYVFVRPSQYRWADYVARRAQGDYTVISPAHPQNENVGPGPIGKAWGKPTRASGITGFLDELTSGALGYKTTKGKRGIEHMPDVSGMSNRTAQSRKRSSASKTARKAGRKGRGLWKEIKSLW